MSQGFSPALQIHAREIYLTLLDGNADELSRLASVSEEMQNLLAERAAAAWRAAFAFVAEGDSFAKSIEAELKERSTALKPEDTVDVGLLQLDDRYLELRRRMGEKHADCNCPACLMRRKLEEFEKAGPMAFTGEKAAEILEKLGATLSDALRSKKKPEPEAKGDVAAEGTV